MQSKARGGTGAEDRAPPARTTPMHGATGAWSPGLLPTAPHFPNPWKMLAAPPWEPLLAIHHVGLGIGVFSWLLLVTPDSSSPGAISPLIKPQSIPSLQPADEQRGLPSQHHTLGRVLGTNLSQDTHQPMPISRGEVRAGFIPCPIPCCALRHSGAGVHTRPAQAGSSPCLAQNFHLRPDIGAQHLHGKGIHSCG